MSLIDSFLNESVAGASVWVALRADGNRGTGTQDDPYNGSTLSSISWGITLDLPDPSKPEARALYTGFQPNLAEGDVVRISGVTGTLTQPWNGNFIIYDVTTTGFRYWMSKVPLNPGGAPVVNRLQFSFDFVMRSLPGSCRIFLGPGTFQTRGYAANDLRGWQPKTGQKIMGQGFDVTTLQLVGSVNADQHYHAVGMPIEPTGTTAIAPLERFEISDLTIDCNLDGHSGKPTPGYANVACGAVRLLGNRCRIRNLKAINWGTKSLKEGAFVFSIIGASGAPSKATNGTPILTECEDNVIEDCIAIKPSRHCARETTVLHLGGVANASNYAQGFHRVSRIRNNFVDCRSRPYRPVAHCSCVAPGLHPGLSRCGPAALDETGATSHGRRGHRAGLKARYVTARLGGPGKQPPQNQRAL